MKETEKTEDVEEAIDPKALIRKGLKIISDQIDKIEEEVSEDGVLGPREAKRLNDYIKVCVQISKDIKDLGDLSDDEISRMTKEEIAALAREASEQMGLTFNKENRK